MNKIKETNTTTLFKFVNNIYKNVKNNALCI